MMLTPLGLFRPRCYTIKLDFAIRRVKELGEGLDIHAGIGEREIGVNCGAENLKGSVMGRSYYKKKLMGNYEKTGYSKSDAEIRSENAGVGRLALMALAIFCVYQLVMYLFGQAVNLVHSINDPSNLTQPYKFLAYYCNYLFFKPFSVIGYFWHVTVTDGLTKFHNFNYVIFFSVLALLLAGFFYAFTRLEEHIRARVVVATFAWVAIPAVILIGYWVYLLFSAILGWLFA